MAKRSLTIAGHRTSVSLEEPFWLALAEIATVRGSSLAALVAISASASQNGSSRETLVRW
ncbi:MAG: ribbon-helix-helix domain-containing protein, partial [Bauldia sp.]|nr:ribbon-helix-helix domain-containing protein [Bauldia sp.]